jgi:hypothetical protein
MPYVALVLSFVAVLGFGRLVGPAEAGPDRGPAPTSTALPPPAPAPAPTETTPTTRPPTSGESEPPMSPSASTGTTGSTQAPGIGLVTVDLIAKTATNPALLTTTQPTADGRLQVCVTLSAETTIRGDDSWQQHDPPDGRKYCAEVERTQTTVEFEVVPR